jgi:hypothetical protein
VLNWHYRSAGNLDETIEQERNQGNSGHLRTTPSNPLLDRPQNPTESGQNIIGVERVGEKKAH